MSWQRRGVRDTAVVWPLYRRDGSVLFLRKRRPVLPGLALISSVIVQFRQVQTDSDWFR